MSLRKRFNNLHVSIVNRYDGTKRYTKRAIVRMFFVCFFLNQDTREYKSINKLRKGLRLQVQCPYSASIKRWRL